jgi:hypothetical protein
MSDEIGYKGWIRISVTKYKELLKEKRFLDCLREGGVDNWEWYGEAVQLFNDTRPEEEEE